MEKGKNHIFPVLMLAIIVSLISAEKKAFPLKGQNHFIEGIDEYRVLVKFDKAYEPDIDEAGNVTLFYKNPPKSVLAPITKYNLTFSRVLKLSTEDIKRLRTPQRHVPDEKGFNILDFAGLLYVKSPFTEKEKLLEICDVLEELNEVEYAELQPVHEFPPPADIPPTTPPLDSAQDYRGPDPGIDIDYAWSLEIKGEGMRVCDIEYYKGTPMTHEDLEDQGIEFVLSMPSGSRQNHAIAVIGMLVAGENGYGIHGGAPEAEGFVGPEEHGRATTALAAIDSMKEGDVILYEMQTYGAGGGFCPADYSQSLWDATKAGSDAGVIIVAAAGNGNQNLDASSYSSYMDRGDNGSIIVGAGSSDTDHDKLSFSTYGERVNVHGWGQNVYTTSTYGNDVQFGNDINQAYGDGFSGTSSASPIVASAVLLVQNYAKSTYDIILSPVEMRDLLIETGIPQGSGGHIGPIPDIKAAFMKLDSLNTGIKEERIHAKVISSGLYQYESKIKYYVPGANDKSTVPIKLSLYTIKGSLIAVMVNEKKSSGIYDIDVNNVIGKPLASGIYFCQLETLNSQSVIKYTVR
jgi:hypothetical protein